jgi:hypothetical protein
MRKLKLLDCNKISSSELEADVKQDFVPTKVRWQKKFKKIIAHNVMQLTEVGDYEAQNFKQAQIMIRSNTFQFATNPPILVRCCYVSVFFFIFCALANHLIIL